MSRKRYRRACIWVSCCNAHVRVSPHSAPNALSSSRAVLRACERAASGTKDSALRREVAGLMHEGWIDQEVALGYLLHILYGRAFPTDNESARPAGKLAGTAVKRATGKGPGQDWKEAGRHDLE